MIRMKKCYSGQSHEDQLWCPTQQLPQPRLPQRARSCRSWPPASGSRRGSSGPGAARSGEEQGLVTERVVKKKSHLKEVSLGQHAGLKSFYGTAVSP